MERDWAGDAEEEEVARSCWTKDSMRSSLALSRSYSVRVTYFSLAKRKEVSRMGDGVASWDTFLHRFDDVPLALGLLAAARAGPTRLASVRKKMRGARGGDRGRTADLSHLILRRLHSGMGDCNAAGVCRGHRTGNVVMAEKGKTRGGGEDGGKGRVERTDRCS